MSSNHSKNSKTCGEMLTNGKINNTAVVTQDQTPGAMRKPPRDSDNTAHASVHSEKCGFKSFRRSAGGRLSGYGNLLPNLRTGVQSL